MSEFPDANSGGLDPTGTAKPKPPLWRRIRAYAILIALYAGILGLAAAAVPMLHSVFRPGTSFEDRGLHLFYAVGLLLPFGFLVQYFVRVRMKTGTWRGTPEQRRQEREQRRVRQATAARRTARNTLTQYIIKWATCAAMDRTLPLPKRIAGWAVLAMYVAAMLAFAALGLIFFGAAFGMDGKISAILLCVACGLLFLLWPVMAVVKLVRGIRAGRVGATPEDLEQIRAQRSAQHLREWQKPLRSKLIGTAISCAVIALWWMRVTIHHAQHPHESWVTPAIATVPLFYSIWLQFRRPKNASPPNDGAAGTKT